MNCRVVMEAMKNNSWAFNYANNRLKYDPVVNQAARGQQFKTTSTDMMGTDESVNNFVCI